MACTVGQLHSCSASCERTCSHLHTSRPTRLPVLKMPFLASTSACACVAHGIFVENHPGLVRHHMAVVTRSLTDIFVLLQGSTNASAETQQSLRATAAAVTSVALEHLLQHLRRGKTQVLWDCVLSEAHTRIESCLGPGTHALYLMHFQLAQTAFLLPFSSAAAQLLCIEIPARVASKCKTYTAFQQAVNCDLQSSKSCSPFMYRLTDFELRPNHSNFGCCCYCCCCICSVGSVSLIIWVQDSCSNFAARTNLANFCTLTFKILELKTEYCVPQAAAAQQVSAAQQGQSLMLLNVLSSSEGAELRPTSLSFT